MEATNVWSVALPELIFLLLEWLLTVNCFLKIVKSKVYVSPSFTCFWGGRTPKQEEPERQGGGGGGILIISNIMTG